MGSRVSCLRVKHGSISFGEGKKSSMALEKVEANINGSKGSGINYAKRGLIYLKNLIDWSASKLKEKKYTSKINKSPSKRACCACISSEKGNQLTNGLFKMKTFLLKVGGGGNKGNSINGGTGGGNHGKGAHDDKKHK